MHGCAATEEVSQPKSACPDKARTGNGSGFVLAFIHRFGSSLNEHVDFHVCVVDGVFEEVAGDVVVADVSANGEPTAPHVIFHPASGMDADCVAQT